MKHTLALATVLILALALAPLALTAPAAQDGQGNTQYYTVKPGDNLTKIARQFGVTVEVLQLANSISDPNTIMVGQVLAVPVGNAVVPATSGLTASQHAANVAQVFKKAQAAMTDVSTGQISLAASPYFYVSKDPPVEFQSGTVTLQSPTRATGNLRFSSFLGDEAFERTRMPVDVDVTFTPQGNNVYLRGTGITWSKLSQMPVRPFSLTSARYHKAVMDQSWAPRDEGFEIISGVPTRHVSATVGQGALVEIVPGALAGNYKVDWWFNANTYQLVRQRVTYSNGANLTATIVQ